MGSDIAISRAARLLPIARVAEKLGIGEEALSPHGRHMAKLDGGFVRSLTPRAGARLVLVTAISPTPAGEGKSTTTIGLGDGLNRIGKRAAICLREPSLGPCFGQKGGATGGGHAQVAPMEQINLHFTGDFHAITTANNLLAAMVDNHVYWGNRLGIDPRRVTWRRALDMNDRSLRQIVTSLGGIANGVPREAGFDITVASEVMAVFCLARDLDDLHDRLGRLIVASTFAKQPVTAADLKAHGAMTVLLKDALQPNLVQTLEGNPALVHGGPFANIAHGCNSVIATRAALGLADYVVTEAGFGADLGAEKFIDIKCRSAGFEPAAAVIVATARALKMHGGVAKADLGVENVPALAAGLANLDRHIANMRGFGLPVVVAINHFASDTEAEHALIRQSCAEKFGIEAITCRHWAEGSSGIEDLAHHVVSLTQSPVRHRPLYGDEMPLLEKVRTVATRIYGAADVAADAKVRERFAQIEAAGFGRLPVCIAKTQYSFSTDPAAMGAPSGHIVPIREVRLSAGAGFVVVICGDILTMPGLPRVPAAERIGIDASGEIEGLY